MQKDALLGKRQKEGEKNKNNKIKLFPTGINSDVVCKEKPLKLYFSKAEKK